MGWFFLLLVFFSVSPDSIHTARVPETVRAVTGDPLFEQAIWGIYARDVHSGAEVVNWNASRALIPASNFKLLTTAAALDILGPAFRYHTPLLFRGAIQGDTLIGDLIIKGSGDPTFGSSAFDEDPLKAWAEGLAAQGIRIIQGRLIGDDNIFPEVGYPDGWDVGYLATEAFAAPPGGLVYHDNVAELWIDAYTEPGRPPRVYGRPSGYLDIVNHARVHRRRTWSFEMHRALGSRRVEIRGNIPHRWRGKRDLPADNPTLLTLYAFREALENAGIDIRALELYDIDDLPDPPHTTQARTLFTYTSPPLTEIIRVINKESHNLFAEQLFLTMGKGNRKRAERAIRRFLKRALIPDDGLQIQDGSGLSRKDLITPRTLVDLLIYMYHAPFSALYLPTLPEGHEPHSTLENRLEGVPVQAKTGSLEFVRALSGYVTTDTGRILAFSILVNHYDTRSRTVQDAIDRLVRILASGNFSGPPSATVQHPGLPERFYPGRANENQE